MAGDQEHQEYPAEQTKREVKEEAAKPVHHGICGSTFTEVSIIHTSVSWLI